MAKKQIQISYFLVVLFKDCLFLKQDFKDVIFLGGFFVSMKIYWSGIVGQETIENYYLMVRKADSRKPGGHIKVQNHTA